MRAYQIFQSYAANRPRHMSGVMRKCKAFTRSKHVFHSKVIRDMSIRVVGELQEHELKFGQPSDLEPVVVDIGIVNGFSEKIVWLQADR